MKSNQYLRILYMYPLQAVSSLTYDQHPGVKRGNLSTARQIFGTVPRLPVPRLPPGGSLGTPKILSTGAILHLGPIRLHVENWECRALNSSARCQKFGVPYRFF